MVLPRDEAIAHSFVNDVKLVAHVSLAHDHSPCRTPFRRERIYQSMDVFIVHITAKSKIKTSFKLKSGPRWQNHLKITISLRTEASFCFSCSTFGMTTLDIDAETRTGPMLSELTAPVECNKRRVMWSHARTNRIKSTSASSGMSGRIHGLNGLFLLMPVQRSLRNNEPL